MDELTLPDGWKRAAPDLVQRAVKAALQALSEEGPYGASPRLADYYKLEGNAGATFADLLPVQPRNFNVSDLHAVTMLAVSVGPRATRRLLDEGQHRRETLAALAALDDLGVVHLEKAGASVLEAMDRFFLAQHGACEDPTAENSNPWVTVSKICARKRPGLFPVRDGLVCTALGLIGPGLPRGNRKIDWQVYAHLLKNAEVGLRLDEVQRDIASAQHDKYRHDQFRMRILDAAVWTHASWKARERRKARGRHTRRPRPRSPERSQMVRQRRT